MDNHIVLVVGLGITVFGALMWAIRKSANAKNRIEFLGLQVTLSTPAIAVMFVGVVLVLASLTQNSPTPDPNSIRADSTGGANDQPARYPESDATRVESFEFTTPPSEIKAGTRKWTRVAPDVWEQIYGDGTKEYLYAVKRVHLDGDDCDGTVVADKTDRDFQAFIPDKNCADREFLFRRVSQGPDWHRYVPIDAMN